MKKALELVFVPAPFFSHFVGAIEFAKRLIDRDHQISITFLIMKTGHSGLPNLNAYANSLVDSRPRIKLIDLPQVEFPSPELLKSTEIPVCVFIENHKQHIKNILTDLLSSKSNSNQVRVFGIVLDFMCICMIDVANELGLPSYLLITCNASFLCLLHYLKTSDMLAKSKFKDSDPELVLSSFTNPIPPRVLPQDFRVFTIFENICQRLWDANGIIVNSFMELESNAINSLLDGEVPPVYPVGPMINVERKAHNDVMIWLDDQPTRSVVFLCFGSTGGFCGAQVNQIALALENSGHRFLWSLRDSVLIKENKNLEDKVIEKFLERTKGRGMICKWAPQTEVLAHAAIGGFVSHCGWTSILESLWFGVPIVTWPIFGEQQLNAFLLVKEMGLAVELKLDYRIGDGLVKAVEIEKAIRCVMEDDNTVLRERVKEIGEKARKTVMDGGSSFNNLGRLIEDMIGK